MIDGAILGVDPGLNGALALYWPADRMLIVHDTPTIGDSKQRVVNAAEVALILQARVPVAAFIEDVHAVQKSGASSAFRFGESKGIVLGVLGAMQIPLHRVSPQRWKKHFQITRDKDVARKLATEFFPQHSGLFARVMDEHRAEAALIARYGAETLA
jgi:crossover junction endodeoxyribonuclease RuvC